MAGTEILREFLVKLGYQVDQNSHRVFVENLGFSTNQVLELGKSVKETAQNFVEAVADMTKELDDLYFASKRTGATAEGIEAIGFAASRTGASVASARGAVEGLASFMRGLPGGGQGWLRMFGVDTNQDTIGMIQSLGARLREMPTYRGLAISRMVGMDERMFLALTSGELNRYMDEFNHTLHLAGVNTDEAAKAANYFWNELSRLGVSMTAIREKIAQDLGQRTGHSIEAFRELIEANFAKITLAIEHIMRTFALILDQVPHFVSRIGDLFNDLTEWYAGLDSGTRDSIKVILELVAAARLLNTIFLSTPTGRILGLALALFTLYDDYKSWKVGAEHLIDWEKWDDDIKLALDGLRKLKGGFDWLAEGLLGPGGSKAAMNDLLIWIGSHWVPGMLGQLGRVYVIIDLIVRGLQALGVIGARGEGQQQQIEDAERRRRDWDYYHPGESPNLFPSWWPRILGGRGPTPLSTAEQDAKAVRLMARLQRDLGITREAAAGDVSNAYAESGLQSISERGQEGNPRAGFGMWQFTGDRRAGGGGFLGRDVFAAMHPEFSPEEVDYQYHLWELRNKFPALLERMKRPGVSATAQGADIAQTYEFGNDPGLMPKLGGHIAMADRYAGLGGAPSVSQTNNVTIHGVSDPHAAGAEVHAALDRANADLIRNLGQGVVR